MIRALVAASVVWGAVAVASAQPSTDANAYLSWTASQAERLGRTMRVNGRVGNYFGFRGLRTENSISYKLRATWFTPDAIRASARFAQINKGLSARDAADAVRMAESVGGLVVMVELDPHEGSGVIPLEWLALFGPADDESRMVRGRPQPELKDNPAFAGVFRRDYNYEAFWMVFPSRSESGASVIGEGVHTAELIVRINSKEGRVKWPVDR